MELNVGHALMACNVIVMIGMPPAAICQLRRSRGVWFSAWLRVRRGTRVRAQRHGQLQQPPARHAGGVQCFA